MTDRLSHDVDWRPSSSTDVIGKYRKKHDDVERRHGSTRDSMVREEERLPRSERDSVHESDDRYRGRKHNRSASERLFERKLSRSASPKNKECSRSDSPSSSRHDARKRRRRSESRSRSAHSDSESSDSLRSRSRKSKSYKTEKDGERRHKKHHKKDVNVRRSVLTGKKIKLKVHKDRADIEMDSKREELLKFLNSAYD